MDLPRRKPEHVMVPGSLVVNAEKRYIQLWTGDRHEERAGRQADALNRVLTDGHQAVPVWVERPERKR